MRPAKLTVNSVISLVFIILVATGFHSCNQRTTPRVLVFSKTTGWKHSSIPYGIEAIFKLGKENDFLVDTTKNAAFFDDFNLKQYHAVIFNNTTPECTERRTTSSLLERYIQAGGGFVGFIRRPTRSMNGPGMIS